MVPVKLVTSGKGGAGKSTVCVNTAAALARQGLRVLVLEMDAGLRGLDIMLGVSDKAVFDMADVLAGHCPPEKAVVACAYQPRLGLMPAPVHRGPCPGGDELRGLCRALSGAWDSIFLDTPAGLGPGFDVSLAVCSSALLIVTPDPVSVRDGAAVAGLIYAAGVEDLKLVLNRVPPRPRQMMVPDLDMVIDTVGAQLIGAVPEDRAVLLAAAGGTALEPGSPAAIEFENMAYRLQGRYIPLSIR